MKGHFHFELSSSREYTPEPRLVESSTPIGGPVRLPGEQEATIKPVTVCTHRLWSETLGKRAGAPEHKTADHVLEETQARGAKGASPLPWKWQLG